MQYHVIAIVGQHTVLADEAARRIAAEGGTAVVLTWGNGRLTPAGTLTEDAPQRLAEALRAVPSTHDRLDGLIFVMPERTAHAASLTHVEEWEAVQRGLSACLYANLTAAEIMQRSHRDGAIVNVISVYGVKAVPGHSFEAATMGGAISLTKSLGVEWARTGVRVNAVLTLPGAASDRATWRAERIPNRRLPTPSEVWETVRYLLSAEARYVTAEALPAVGGWLAYDYL